MINYQRTNKLSPLPCWREIGRKMSQIVAIFSVGIALSLESGTAKPTSSLAITAPPAGVQTFMADKYVPAKYLRIGKYNIHIIGSPTVSDWFMRETYWVIGNIVAAMKNPADRLKFSGFQAILITNADPDLGGIPGHRNSGGDGWSVFNEALVCTTAVDTINPDSTPVYRGWDTPVHEFGHSIEATLKLFSKTMAYHVANGVPTTGNDIAESYAWNMEQWFDVYKTSSRSKMDAWKQTYFAEVFDTSNTWIPSREPRPAATPGAPVGYTLCSAEGGSFSLPGTCDVAYGANGVFLYRSNRTGAISFNTTTFGSDPVPSVLKSGYYKRLTPAVTPVGPAN